MVWSIPLSAWRHKLNQMYTRRSDDPQNTHIYKFYLDCFPVRTTHLQQLKCNTLSSFEYANWIFHQYFSDSYCQEQFQIDATVVFHKRHSENQSEKRKFFWALFSLLRKIKDLRTVLYKPQYLRLILKIVDQIKSANLSIYLMKIFLFFSGRCCSTI